MLLPVVFNDFSSAGSLDGLPTTKIIHGWGGEWKEVYGEREWGGGIKTPSA